MAKESRPHQSQSAFFDHVFVVVDAATADAIAHSDYLRDFGMFQVRTTIADGGTGPAGICPAVELMSRFSERPISRAPTGQRAQA